MITPQTSQTNTHYAIVVAGGKGLRMGTNLPKQFLPLNGKPVLMHTLERFSQYSSTLQIILVLPKEQHEYWQKLCKEHVFAVKHTVVCGGETRFHSCLNGLKAIPKGVKGYVAIHDGVRPLVSVACIERCFNEAEKHKAVIPVVPVVDTLRFTNEQGEAKNVDRSAYSIVQTPQTFSVSLIKRAYEQPFSPTFTDDASVVESIKEPVFVVEGNRENIKITTPCDLLVAEALLKSIDNAT